MSSRGATGQVGGTATEIVWLVNVCHSAPTERQLGQDYLWWCCDVECILIYSDKQEHDVHTVLVTLLDTMKNNTAYPITVCELTCHIRQESSS